MAEWIRNGHECSKCGFRLRYSAKCYEGLESYSAKCYEWLEKGDHGYWFKTYAITPEECPKCHDEMTAVVWEGGDNDA